MPGEGDDAGRIQYSLRNSSRANTSKRTFYDVILQKTEPGAPTLSSPTKQVLFEILPTSCSNVNAELIRGKCKCRAGYFGDGIACTPCPNGLNSVPGTIDQGGCRGAPVFGYVRSTYRFDNFRANVRRNATQILTAVSTPDELALKRQMALSDGVSLQCFESGEELLEKGMVGVFGSVAQVDRRRVQVPQVVDNPVLSANRTRRQAVDSTDVTVQVEALDQADATQISSRLNDQNAVNRAMAAFGFPTPRSTTQTPQFVAGPGANLQTDQERDGDGGLSAGEIAGIVIGSVLGGLLLLCCIGYLCYYYIAKKGEEKEGRGGGGPASPFAPRDNRRVDKGNLVPTGKEDDFNDIDGPPPIPVIQRQYQSFPGYYPPLESPPHQQIPLPPLPPLPPYIGSAEPFGSTNVYGSDPIGSNVYGSGPFGSAVYGSAEPPMVVMRRSVEPITPSPTRADLIFAGQVIGQAQVVGGSAGPQGPGVGNIQTGPTGKLEAAW